MKALAVLLASALAACSGDAKPRVNGLLLTLDTTRADALSCYGNAQATTPRLDALAADGVLFTGAHTVMALTQPAHTSMLTGLAPVRHGIRDNGVYVLPAEAETVAERARAAGFDTAAFVSSVVLADDFGLEQGFETYSVPRRRGDVERAHGAERPARDTIDAALAWLAERDGTKPFFLWIHLYDPHHPYAPPPEFAGRFATPYLDEVAAMDAELGRLFDGLAARGLWDETFVLALADHGEAFGEHGEVTHGTYVYEPTLAIPFLARWPASAGNRRAGERSAELVGAVDVAPTLAEALGLAPLDDIDGLSFATRTLPAERGLYFESYYGWFSCNFSPLAGWLDAHGKYIHSSAPELYDWRADPREAQDLAPARAESLEPYRAAIARAAAAPALVAEALGADSEALAGIQDLGYTGAGEGAGELPHPLAPNTLPSPRSQASFFASQARAQGLAEAGDLAGAARVYEEVLVSHADNFHALEELGTLYMKLGRPADAVPLLERLVARAAPRGRQHQKLGLALVAAGEPEKAVPVLVRAVELTAGRPRYLDSLREVLRQLGREDEMAAIEARYARPR
jgi:arylsulfatase A-like enzyme